jgi:hypothetical protein
MVHPLVSKDFAFEKTEAGNSGGHGSGGRQRQESTHLTKLTLQL